MLCKKYIVDKLKFFSFGIIITPQSTFKSPSSGLIFFVLWVITYQRLLSFICRNVTAKIRIMNIYFPYLIVAMSFVDKSMSNMMGVDDFKPFQSYSHRISIFFRLNASLNYVKLWFI